jgi:hypothetical protein
METKFTEQESLQVITQMIQQAQNNFRKGAGNITIFWGYLVVFTALLNFALAFVWPAQSPWVWLLMIPGWLITYIMISKTDRSAIVKTLIDKIYASIWISYAISAIILQFVFWAVYYYFDVTLQFTMMVPVILILTGSGQFISGKLYRFKPYISGGFIFWLGAVVCFLILPKVQYQFLVLAICMVFGYIIPGMKLNRKAQDNV